MDIILKLSSAENDKYIKEMVSSGIIIKHVFKSFPMVVIDIKDAKYIDALSFVEHWEEEEFFQLQEFRSIPNVRINKLKARNYMGSNAIVAVIDSGMDSNGLEIHRNEVFSASATSIDARFNGKLHGTIVGKTVKSIAPWCRLVNLKVMDDDTFNIRKSSILKALDFVYTNNIKIVNISLGKKGSCHDSCLVCETVNMLREEGFAVVASIGNWGHGVTACPGNAKRAVTVGAVNSTRSIAEYSGTAPDGVFKPNVLAPGSVVVDGTTYSGTSFATPVITGMVAALSNDFELELIIDSIQQTAVSIGLPHNEQGYGLIHVEGLLGVLHNEKTAN